MESDATELKRKINNMESDSTEPKPKRKYLFPINQSLSEGSTSPSASLGSPTSSAGAGNQFPQEASVSQFNQFPQVVTSKFPQEASVSHFNGFTKSELQDSINHLDQLHPAVKILLLKLFPETYIVNHSVSGKASNSKTPRKPQFDLRLYGVMVSIIKDKFGSSNKDITEKVHSVQKYLQNKKN